MARLFDFVAVVLLGEEGKPVLQHVFPESAKDETRGILHFCWPEGQAALDETHAVTTRSENFSFVLTESDGSKRFGYCRRFLRSLPAECVCVVSKLPSVALFQELLNAVEMRRAAGWPSSEVFLSACLAQPCPAPGERLVVSVPSLAGNNTLDEIRLVRPEVSKANRKKKMTG
jgi:hypothetical protein